MNVSKTHYTGKSGEEYHRYREESRSVANQVFRSTYFEDLSDESAIILDFGCGTGGVLSNLKAKSKIGVEVSEVAKAQASKVLDRVVSDLSELSDQSVDTVMSFHAIEHTTHPFGVLGEIKRVLKPGGRVRIILPCESLILNGQHRRWREGDMDMHLFRWSPLTFGNLAVTAGFDVEQVRLSPMSSGGKLAAWLRPVPPLARLATWGKAILGRRIQLILDARKPA